MALITRGFRGRRPEGPVELPPGQYLTRDFPVLSAGPTPRIDLDRWRLTIDTEVGTRHQWTWRELLALPAEQQRVDIHCVTKWSKLGTDWEGVSLDTLFAGVDTAADYALVLGIDPTATVLTCAGCGRPAAFAEQPVYPGGPGEVVRCRHCADVVARVVRTPTDVWLDLRGARSWRIPLDS